MLLITDPTDDDLERNHRFVTWITDPPDIEFLRMGLDQEFGALDTMTQRHLRVVHRI
jgi:hypothetical protein